MSDEDAKNEESQALWERLASEAKRCGIPLMLAYAKHLAFQPPILHKGMYR